MQRTKISLPEEPFRQRRNQGCMARLQPPGSCRIRCDAMPGLFDSSQECVDESEITIHAPVHAGLWRLHSLHKGINCGDAKVCNDKRPPIRPSRLLHSGAVQPLISPFAAGGLGGRGWPGSLPMTFQAPGGFCLPRELSERSAGCIKEIKEI